jgi:hypothetical protein
MVLSLGSVLTKDIQALIAVNGNFACDRIRTPCDMRKLINNLLPFVLRIVTLTSGGGDEFNASRRRNHGFSNRPGIREFDVSGRQGANGTTPDA